MKKCGIGFCKLKLLLAILIFSIFMLNSQKCYAKDVEEESEISEKIDNYLQTALEDANVKGMALEIVNSDTVVYSNTYGDAKETSDNFIIGSMSKSFTALAIVDLADKGIVNLDVSICEYLEDYPELEEITVRDLLNQVSGIASNQLLSDINITSSKGQFQYANANYNLLGKIIEKVTGKEYTEYVKESIFEPLEMTNTYANYGEDQQKTLVQGYTSYFGIMIPRNVMYPDKDSWSQVPAGYIISNIEDMGKYLQMYLRKGNSIFDSETVNTVLHNGVDASTDTSAVSDMYGGDAKYCMGWIEKKVDDEPIIYHAGKVENFTSVMVLLPERDLAAVMLFNSMDFLVGQSLIEQIEENVVSIIRGEEIKEINSNSYILQHGIINVVCLVMIFLCSLPILIFLKREKERKGNIVISIIIHLVCPILLAIAFPIAGMPLFVIRGFVPDIFLVLILSITILILGGIIKFVKR